VNVTLLRPVSLSARFGAFARDQFWPSEEWETNVGSGEPKSMPTPQTFVEESASSPLTFFVGRDETELHEDPQAGAALAGVVGSGVDTRSRITAAVSADPPMPCKGLVSLVEKWTEKQEHDTRPDPRPHE
jgi:hypothetical protein